MQWLSEMCTKAEPLLGRFTLVKGSLHRGAQGCVRLAEVRQPQDTPNPDPSTTDATGSARKVR